MAADALKEKAKELGVEIKVETNGSSGIKHKLTAQEIEDAPAIIVAADKQVEMERFKGKRVLQVPVTAGIRRPQELIEKAMNQDAPIYQAAAAVQQLQTTMKKRKASLEAVSETRFIST